MNRILFEPEEVDDGVVTFGGERAAHVLEVLHGEVGQILKTGVVDGLIGTSVITAIRREGAEVTVSCTHGEESVRPWIDLILAPPRPRVMKRLLPQLATMGVGKIVLVGAKKVEKDFWGATLLKPENYRPLLVDGLMQAGTSILPKIELRRNFRKFVREELDTLFPTADRLVAHPYEVPGAWCPVPGAERGVPGAWCGERGARCLVPDAWCGEYLVSKHQAPSTRHQAPSTRHQAPSTPLLAIGPEGGWTDEEVALLEEHGFRRSSLGSRILRTDTATIALLAQLMMRYPS